MNKSDSLCLEGKKTVPTPTLTPRNTTTHTQGPSKPSW